MRTLHIRVKVDPDMRMSEAMEYATEQAVLSAERRNAMLEGYPHWHVEGDHLVTDARVRTIDTIPSGLSNAERHAREVLTLLDMGLSTREIAAGLGISLDACADRLSSAGYADRAKPFATAGRSMRARRPKTGQCADCDAPIGATSVRCRSCGARHRNRNRKAA